MTSGCHRSIPPLMASDKANLALPSVATPSTKPGIQGLHTTSAVTSAAKRSKVVARVYTAPATPSTRPLSPMMPTQLVPDTGDPFGPLDPAPKLQAPLKPRRSAMRLDEGERANTSGGGIFGKEG